MEITEVRIKLMEEPGERLKAFCSITLDHCFVIRDLKIIEGASGPFVAMPSRKLTAHCPRCGMKNHLRAPYCNQCGSHLSMDRTPIDSDGRAKLYADIAHPINSACREMIQQRVIAEYAEEQIRAKEPGYVSRYDDFDFDMGESLRRHAPAPAALGSGSRLDGPHPRQGATTSSERPPERSTEHGNPSMPKHTPNAPRRRADESFGAGVFSEG